MPCTLHDVHEPWSASASITTSHCAVISCRRSTGAVHAEVGFQWRRTVTPSPRSSSAGRSRTTSTTTRAGDHVSGIAYVSEVRVERLEGRLRVAYLPGEEEPVLYGVHGAVAEHYGVDPGSSPSHATTIDHLVGAALG